MLTTRLLILHFVSSGGVPVMTGGSGGLRGCTLPINDIRGLEGMSYTKQEKLLRCKLAAVYRLIDLFGWTQNIYNHVTVSIRRIVMKRKVEFN